VGLGSPAAIPESTIAGFEGSRQAEKHSGPPMMSDPLTTLCDYASASEAELARGLLESHGISVFLADENITQLYARSIFSVRLQVRESDLADARQILAAALSASADESDRTAGE
jgi:hypothetical protein